MVTPTSDPTPCLSAAPSADELLLPTRALSDGKARPVWFKSPPWLGFVVLGFIWKYQQMPVVASGLMARRESLQGGTAAVYLLQEHLSMDTPCPASPQIPAASTSSLGSLQLTAEQETSLFFMELLAFHAHDGCGARAGSAPDAPKNEVFIRERIQKIFIMWSI